MNIKTTKRAGVAAVEAAVCLPVIVLIFLGSLEISAGIFQEYNAQAAAYEISKVALRAKSTGEDVQTAADEILSALKFSQYNIQIEVEPRTTNQNSVETPLVTSFDIPQSGPPTAGLEELPRGTLLRLTLVAQTQANGLKLFSRFLGAEIQSDCVFVKEF